MMHIFNFQNNMTISINKIKNQNLKENVIKIKYSICKTNFKIIKIYYCKIANIKSRKYQMKLKNTKSQIPKILIISTFLTLNEMKILKRKFKTKIIFLKKKNRS